MIKMRKKNHGMVKVIYESSIDQRYDPLESFEGYLRAVLIKCSGGSLFPVTSRDTDVKVPWEMSIYTDFLDVYHDRNTDATVILVGMQNKNKLVAATRTQKQMKDLKGLVKKIKEAEVKKDV